jgi:hypothetical protein
MDGKMFSLQKFGVGEAPGWEDPSCFDRSRCRKELRRSTIFEQDSLFI